MPPFPLDCPVWQLHTSIGWMASAQGCTRWTVPCGNSLVMEICYPSAKGDTQSRPLPFGSACRICYMSNQWQRPPQLWVLVGPLPILTCHMFEICHQQKLNPKRISFWQDCRHPQLDIELLNLLLILTLLVSEWPLMSPFLHSIVDFHKIWFLSHLLDNQFCKRLPSFPNSKRAYSCLLIQCDKAPCHQRQICGQYAISSWECPNALSN